MLAHRFIPALIAELVDALSAGPDRRQPIYEDFSSRQHVAEGLDPHGSSPVVLCLNATRSLTTAVAVQFVGKALYVLADHVREADPGVAVPEIVRDAGLELGRKLVLVAALALRQPLRPGGARRGRAPDADAGQRRRRHRDRTGSAARADATADER